MFGLDAAVQSSSVAVRARTGFVSEEKDLLGQLSVAQAIRFTAAFYPRWRRDQEQHYLARFELPADRKVKDLSRGTRTQLALLLALCRGAELLVLDEPTSGLDPATAEEVLHALVAAVAGGETTVFFSSHQIAEVDQIADRIAIVSVIVRGGADRLIDEARSLQPVSIDAEPLTLKDVFLETVARED